MDDSTVWKIINKYFEDNPQALVRHHIESYNDFFKNGIFQIFKEKNPLVISTRYDKDLDDYRSQCIMHFGGKDGTKIYFGKPVIYDDKDNTHYMYPNEARLRNMTYGMTVHYDVDIEFIDILEKGQVPRTPLDDEEEMLGGQGEDIEQTPNFKLKTTADLEHECEMSKRTDGGNSMKTQEQEQSGGAPATVGTTTVGTKRRKPKRKGDLEMTPAEMAIFREALEKSMITPNKQKTEMVLEKIFLGKFPIMVQSNYCVLSGLPREIRHTMGECLNDVGGYFIIDGKEKTVVTQEKFADNMLYIRESGDEKYLYSAEIRSVSENVSKPIRTLSVKIMAPTPSYTFKNIVVNIPNVRKPVPLFILFRALGILSDKDIITTCLLDLEKNENMLDLFAPSVHDAGGIFTQTMALTYIATFTKGKTVSHALEILADYFLPHIGEINFKEKAFYLGYVVNRLLSVYTGAEQPTDRDNFKYKRLELVGSLMHDLFREYYTLQMRQIHLAFEQKITYNRSIYESNLPTLIKHNYKEIFRERSLEQGFKKAFKGNWGSQTHTKRIGVVQDLNRLSHNSALSHLRKTNLPLDASVKLVGPRVLHSTQWGLFDPIDTPDGGNIGIHKHLAITAYVTQGYSREPLIAWLREKVKMRLVEECSPAQLATLTKVFVNGYWAGAISDPVESVEKMRLFRRNGLLPIYTSTTFDVRQNTVFIYTDAGRVCRPIFYRDTETGKMSYESKAIQKHLQDGEFSWNELIAGFNKKKDKTFNVNDYNLYELNELYEDIDAESNPARLKRFLEEKAIIDYIDTNETENTLIAMNKEDMEKDKTRVHTHLEIHESLIFGMMCNLINFPENNPATRNSFSCGQSKQACSLYHTNYQVRMDKTAVVLSSGQIPLVKSRYLEHINHESNPYGENTIVAIMCYTGYNVEDAILINEGSLKRGLFQTTYYSTYETHEEKSNTGDSSVVKAFTNIESDAMVVGTKKGYDYSKLDKYGLIRENTRVDEKTVLIGLTASDSSQKTVKIDESKTPKKGQLGVVDKSFITDGEEGHRIAKVRVREIRIPNIGDKMASRSGQKGTIGLVVPECDMPFNKDGIRPDIIVNPHAIPTRMTIGQLVETITGKASALYGGFADCTAFNNKGSKIREFGEMLTHVGYHSSGNEVLYNGMTGEQIGAEIFMGPNYYMRLKHMVKDKINYRAQGPITALTRQPVAGRANDGGLRIGEMERDSVISHGAAEFLRESMMERSDNCNIAICNTTGMMAICNPSKNLFMSPMADGPIKYVGSIEGKNMNIENITKYGRDFSVVAVPYSLKLLLQELQTINIQMRIITEDNIQQMENLMFSNNMNKLLFSNDINPKMIVKQIQDALKNGKSGMGVYNTPAPEESPSPQFPETSPAYQPTEDELMQMFSKAEQNSNSPVYLPYSPHSPDEPPPWHSDEAAEFSPHSPEESPPGYGNEATYSNENDIFSPRSPLESPPKEGEEGYENFLSSQAREYTVGEQVYYRGDVVPGRLWSITYIGDRFLKIERQPDQTSDNNVLMVTAMDVYKQGDFVHSSPMAESIYQQFGGGQSNHLANPNPLSSSLTNPAIHFAPVIKITGGNDFSSEPMGQTSNMNAIEGMSGIASATGTLNIPDIKIKESGEPVASTMDKLPDKMDFSKLIIKKST